MFEIVVMPIIFLVSLLVIVYVRLAQNSKQNKIFKQLALKRNGTVKKGIIFFGQSLVFLQNGNEIKVYSTSGRKNSPPYTYVKCNLNSLRDYKIKICREYRIFGIGTVFGQDIKVNNPNFDTSYVIQGSDEMIVRQFLTQDIQAKMLEFKDNKPILEIKRNKFKFYIPRIPLDEQQYDALIDAGLVLIKRAQEIG